MTEHLSAEDVAAGWRDISTAPKDGTRFVSQDRKNYGKREFRDTYWYVHPSVQAWVTEEIDCCDYEFEATHWKADTPQRHEGEAKVTTNPALLELLDQAVAKFRALPKEEQDRQFAEQKRRIVAAEMAMGDEGTRPLYVPCKWCGGSDIMMCDCTLPVGPSPASQDTPAGTRESIEQVAKIAWETLRSIREFAREGDCERIIRWVNDAGSGYVQTAEKTLGQMTDRALAAEAFKGGRVLTHTEHQRGGGETLPPETQRAVAPLVPVDGQSFSCEQDWINRATRRLTAHPRYRNTEHAKGTGWQGEHFTALCFDQAGNRMRNGGDFMRATREETYPVWWIWPDQIVGLLTALSEASAREGVLEGAITEALSHCGSGGYLNCGKSATDRMRAALPSTPPVAEEKP